MWAKFIPSRARNFSTSRPDELKTLFRRRVLMRNVCTSGSKPLITAADVPDQRPIGVAKDHLPLKTDRVRSQRDEIAAVSAVSEEIAEQALRLIEVDYEDLVANQEEATRRLIDHVGLPWDDACLRPQDVQRTVLTASVWQVRQPVYRKSAGRWKNYGELLRPLRDTLASFGCAVD